MTKKDKKNLMLGVGILIVILIISKSKKTVAGGKTPALFAQEIRKAFDPYSTGFISWNGTDTEALYTIAAQITDWGEVRKNYKALYKSDLVDDLNDELSSAESVHFYNILNRQ